MDRVEDMNIAVVVVVVGADMIADRPSWQRAVATLRARPCTSRQLDCHIDRRPLADCSAFPPIGLFSTLTEYGGTYRIISGIRRWDAHPLKHLIASVYVMQYLFLEQIASPPPKGPIN